jgi:hypothetical protein
MPKPFAGDKAAEPSRLRLNARERRGFDQFVGRDLVERRAIVKNHLDAAVGHRAVNELFTGSDISLECPKESHVGCEIRGRIEDLIEHIG